MILTLEHGKLYIDNVRLLVTFLMVLPFRRCYRFSFSPPHSKSAMDGVSIETASPIPLRNGKGFPVMRDVSIGSYIVGLFTSAYPPAIRRFVVSINVNSINGRSFWALTHVLKKRLKRINPKGINSNAPTSVILVAIAIWVKASILHTLPRLMSCSFRHAVGGVARSRCICLKASTRPGFAIRQIPCVNRCGCSARTNTVQLCASSFFGTHRNNGQPTKGLAGKVNEFCHFVTSKLLTVKDAWQSAVRQSFGSYPSQAKGILA